jgi:hypothetical protein
MKKYIIILLVAGLAGSASAQFSKVGTAGAQFLKIGVGSRYQGMGEASVATAQDVYAMYWNPAGLTSIENSAVSFTNVNWILDIDLNYVGYARNFENIGVFGLSAAVLSMGPQEITTFQQQDGTGSTYTASSYALGVSWAKQLTTKFSFGVTAKYVGERIYQERSSGFAFDFGTLLYTGFKSLRLGMSIANMGPQLEFSGPNLDVRFDDQQGTGSNSPVSASLKTSPYDLPMVFRVGLAYDVDFGSKSILTLCSELKHPNDNSEQGALGAEYGFNNQFFLRGGYKINYEEEHFSFGGGVRASVTRDTKLLIDYSWQDFGRLQSAQRFSVGFTF